MNVWQVTQELMRVPGIGEVKAAKIVLGLGEDALVTIAADPTRLHAIAGLGTRDVTSIVTHVVGGQHRIRLRTYLDEYALGWLTDRVFERYGVQWEEVLRYTPYVLVEFGASFELADAVYLSEQGRGTDDELRIQAAIEHVTRKAVAEGHSYLSRPVLRSRVLGLLGWEHTAHIEQEITRACMGEEHITVTDLTMIERAIAHMLTVLQTTPGPEHPLAYMGQGSLSKEQATALDRAVTHKVSILTGGPGTGKTTALKALVALLKASKIHTALCAPTGRAAKRMAQITGEPAWTIHRLLGYDPEDGFKRDENTVLSTDFLVVDEFSMVDSVLFYHLLKALPVTASLLLVGDRDQLPSVGPGCVLSDLLASETIPATRLSEVFRQEKTSGIVTNAYRINAGLEPQYHLSPDFILFERGEATDTASTITRLVLEVARTSHLDPFTDIQVLAPMYKGAAGVDALNTALQAALNHGGQPHIQAGKRTIRYGDKVMQTRNNYEKGTYNGDIGKVVKVDREHGAVVVAFEDEFGPLYASYARAELDELALAYAITVHKSQGNEYPVVIVPLVMEHAAMLQRNLLYTAVTRARSRVILVGQREAVQMAAESNRSRKRNTTLKEALQHDRKAM